MKTPRREWRLPVVFAYYAVTGVYQRRVVRQTAEAVTVAAGVSGMVVRRAELDEPGGTWFTTARRATEAFVARARTREADPALSAADRRGWRQARAEAERHLKGRRAA